MCGFYHFTFNKLLIKKYPENIKHYEFLESSKENYDIKRLPTITHRCLNQIIIKYKGIQMKHAQK